MAPANIVKPVFKVDFRGSYLGCRHRRLWQGIFNYYKEIGGDLGCLDNLLIDLTNLYRLIESACMEEVEITALLGLESHGTTYFFQDIDAIGDVSIQAGVTGSFSCVWLLLKVSKDKASAYRLEDMQEAGLL